MLAKDVKLHCNWHGTCIDSKEFKTQSEVAMFKKFIWIFILLIMTACTIVFSEQADLGKNAATPEANGTLFQSIGDLFHKRDAVKADEPVLAEEAFPGEADISVDNAAEESFPETAVSSGEASAEGVLESAPVTSKELKVRYIVQDGNPAYLANFNELEKGCAWQGVAGQVFGSDSAPVRFLIVKVFGTWNGHEIEKYAVTGMFSARDYGKAGYEIVLGDVAVDSTTPLFVQVFDSDMTPLSEPFEFITKAKCNRNLVLINFVHK